MILIASFFKRHITLWSENKIFYIWQTIFSNPYYILNAFAFFVLIIIPEHDIEVNCLLFATDIDIKHKIKRQRRVLSYLHQWPLLQTWFNFNPNMDK